MYEGMFLTNLRCAPYLSESLWQQLRGVVEMWVKEVGVEDPILTQLHDRMAGDKA